MAGNVSNLSYETFKADLQDDIHKNAASLKVMNSTMVNPGSERGEVEKCVEANGGAVAVKRKVIPFPLPFRCRECGKEFRKIENLGVHFMKHLSGINGGIENGESQSPYVCRHENCDRTFSNKQERKHHEIRHVKVNNFNCERIQKIFKYK